MGKRKQRKATSSRFKGVIWTEGRWRAHIRVNYRKRWLGCFSDEVAAAKAYDAAARTSFGAFASTNFPQEAGA